MAPTGPSWEQGGTSRAWPVRIRLLTRKVGQESFEEQERDLYNTVHGPLSRHSMCGGPLLHQRMAGKLRHREGDLVRAGQKPMLARCTAKGSLLTGLGPMLRFSDQHLAGGLSPWGSSPWAPRSPRGPPTYCRFCLTQYQAPGLLDILPKCPGSPRSVPPV